MCAAVWEPFACFHWGDGDVTENTLVLLGSWGTISLVEVWGMGEYLKVDKLGEKLIHEVYVGVEFEHVDDVWFDLSNVSIAAGVPRVCSVCDVWSISLENEGFRETSNVCKVKV